LGSLFCQDIMAVVNTDKAGIRTRPVFRSQRKENAGRATHPDFSFRSIRATLLHRHRPLRQAQAN
jgi:hypothetical protein